MIKIISAIFICVILGFSTADYCQDNPEPPLTENILLDLAGILLTGTVSFKGCIGNDPVVDEDVKFLLYDPNIQDWKVLDRTKPEIDPLKPIKIFVHGWFIGICGYNASALAQAYLKRGDYNVIGIDWSIRSIDEYSFAYCAIPGVADIISNFLCLLNKSFEVDLTQQVHTIGHSLGAQVLGITGQKVQDTCKTKIGRISGLDPAGPLFMGKPASARLDPGDGEFVDVMHSNGGLAGYLGDCGHVDFYPNCGTLQKGCEQFSTIEEIIALPLTITTCSHNRSVYYWIESINPGNNTFTSTSCKLCPGLAVLPGLCPKDHVNPTYAVMGEDCPRNPPALKFFVETNAESPFGRGNP